MATADRQKHRRQDANAPRRHLPRIYQVLRELVRRTCEAHDLATIRGYAEDSGEGRWTVEAAIDNAVPMPAIAASLFARFASRQDDSPAMKAIAAMRNQFGGHAVHTSPPAGGDANPA